jgi:hypothetical protein
MKKWLARFVLGLFIGGLLSLIVLFFYSLFKSAIHGDKDAEALAIVLSAMLLFFGLWRLFFWAVDNCDCT